MKMEKNKVQVYGLQRSGTNFIEWTLNNNFIDLDYKNIYVKGDIKNHEHFNKRTSLKHTYPKSKYSDYVIVIYKPYEVWVESMKKDKRKLYKKEVYDEFIKKAKNLEGSKTIIVEHSWCVENYIEFLSMISEKFNLKLIDNPQQPEMRLDKGGAHSKETNEKFK